MKGENGHGQKVTKNKRVKKSYQNIFLKTPPRTRNRVKVGGGDEKGRK